MEFRVKRQNVLIKNSETRGSNDKMTRERKKTKITLEKNRNPSQGQ